MRKPVDHVNQPPGATPPDVLESIHAVVQVVRAHRQRVLADAAAGLAPMEGRALAFFMRHPGATQSELVAHTGRDKGQVARLVASLRERGLLEATADPADRRSVRLAPTAQARTIHQGLQRATRRLAQRAVQGLSDAEQAQLLELLARLRRNLDDAGPS